MAQRQWRSDDTDLWLYAFGDGSDGSSYSAPANASCSGTASNTSLTLGAASTFANGDLVLIHQSRGTGATTWELNKIASGAGTTSLTLTHALCNTYTEDGGNSQAQIVEMKQYDTLSLGATTLSNWDQNVGGILPLFDKGTLTITGAVNGSGKGFIGGLAWDSGSTGYNGEGTAGARTISALANGNGGGAGADFQNQGGAGGGHGTAGTSNGSAIGGAAAGNAGLTALAFGGGGGGFGSFGGHGQSQVGGNGGGIVMLFAKDIVISSGSIAVNGANGANIVINADNVGGGGGAGGAVLIKCQTASLGTNAITASAGAGSGAGGGAKSGQNGGVGRIHIDYKTSYTGTTSPTIDARQDLTITEPLAVGGGFLFNFI